MNFTELVDELLARGADYLDEDAASRARAERWINEAYREILNLQAWPFLEARASSPPDTGQAEITDLRRIRFVLDTDNGSQPLTRISLDDLAAMGADLTLTGTPYYYYTENGTTSVIGSAVMNNVVVNTYPVGGNIDVYYIKRVLPMSGTDVPAFSDEYHDLIVHRAMIKVYLDSDNFEAATALREEFNAGVSAMAEDYQLVSREVTYINVDSYDG